MNVTELLVTGYDGDEPVFAVNLVSGTAAVALTSIDDNGDTVVDSTWKQTSQAFAGVRELIEELAVAQAR
jgi:hypothetical protein